MRFLLAPLLLFSAIGPVSPDSLAGEESPAIPPAIQPFEHSAELFPILPWDVLHGWKAPFRDPKHGLESIADCDFTFAGFVSP